MERPALPLCFLRTASSCLALTRTLTLAPQNGIELLLNSDRSVTIFPTAHVEEVFEAIYRVRQQWAHEHEKDSRERPSPRRGSLMAADAEVAFTADPHAGQPGTPKGGGADAGGLAATALSTLLAKATLEKYKQGDVIIEHGSRHGTLFNIAKGRVAVEVVRVNEETGLPATFDLLSPPLRSS